MGNAQMLTRTIDPSDPVVDYGYPATAYVETINAGDGSFFHDIRYAGAPSSNFDAAPIGSTFVDYSTGDNYIKTGATTWTKASP